MIIQLLNFSSIHFPPEGMSFSGQRKVFLDLSLGITSEHFGVSYRLKTHPTPAQYTAFLEVFREVLNLPMLNPEQLNGVYAYRCFVGPGIAVDDLWGDLGGITVGVGGMGTHRRHRTRNGILLFVTMEHPSSGELFDFDNSLMLHLHVESFFIISGPFHSSVPSIGEGYGQVSAKAQDQRCRRFTDPIPVVRCGER